MHSRWSPNPSGLHRIHLRRAPYCPQHPDEPVGRGSVKGHRSRARRSYRLREARMEIDLRIRTVDADPATVVDAAVAAERAGFAAVWLADQLSGDTSGGKWNLECWTVLCAVAARTERIQLGPLVLNIANRDPATVAIAAATLQWLSRGRLLLGLGAGAGAKSPYSRDQLQLGRTPASDAERRAGLVMAIRQTRAL